VLVLAPFLLLEVVFQKYPIPWYFTTVTSTNSLSYLLD
jgi:hypothetical protein